MNSEIICLREFQVIAMSQTTEYSLPLNLWCNTYCRFKATNFTVSPICYFPSSFNHKLLRFYFSDHVVAVIKINRIFLAYYNIYTERIFVKNASIFYTFATATQPHPHSNWKYFEIPNLPSKNWIPSNFLGICGRTLQLDDIDIYSFHNEINCSVNQTQDEQILSLHCAIFRECSFLREFCVKPIFWKKIFRSRLSGCSYRWECWEAEGFSQW